MISYLDVVLVHVEQVDHLLTYVIKLSTMRIFKYKQRRKYKQSICLLCLHYQDQETQVFHFFYVNLDEMNVGYIQG